MSKLAALHHYKQTTAEPCLACHLAELQKLERHRAIKLFIIGLGVITLAFGTMILLITRLI